MVARTARPSANTDGRSGIASEWQRQYLFTLNEAHDVDREVANHWTSTRANTRFTTLLVASRVTEDGFAALTGRMMRINGLHETSEMLLDSPAAMQDALDRHFGIMVTAAEAETLFAFAPD